MKPWDKEDAPLTDAEVEFNAENKAASPDILHADFARELERRLRNAEGILKEIWVQYEGFPSDAIEAVAPLWYRNACEHLAATERVQSQEILPK